MTPPSAETRWWLASVVRHLSTVMPGIEVVPGPLSTPPESLPLVVMSEQGRVVHPILGGQVSSTENEQGAWVEITYAVHLYAAPDTWGHGVQGVWDTLQVALAGGTVPLISEVDAEVLVQHGTLLVRLEAGQPKPAPSDAVTPAIDGPWQIHTGQLLLRGQICWIEGGE